MCGEGRSGKGLAALTEAYLSGGLTTERSFIGRRGGVVLMIASSPLKNYLRCQYGVKNRFGCEPSPLPHLFLSCLGCLSPTVFNCLLDGDLGIVWS